MAPEMAAPQAQGPPPVAAQPGDFQSARDAALAYARRGLPVFPCRARAKDPLIAGGFKAATTDAARIREWWTRWPDANIGMPTGSASGILVLDVDPRNGGEDGLEELIAQHGRWGDTCEVITGGGGRHIYFQHVAGVRCASIGRGLDIKADGGYVIVPPSVHPSGGRYDFDDIRGAAALDHIAPAPEWLVKRLKNGRDFSRNFGHNSGQNSDITAQIPEGQRNNKLTSIAGAMRRQGCTSAEIEKALLEINRRRCKPPLPEDEVRQIAESIGRYEPAEQHSDQGWQAELIRTERGTPRALLANAVTALEKCPAWQGVFGYDEFAFRTVLMKPAPWTGKGVQFPAEWTPTDDALAAMWLQNHGIYVSPDVAGQAVEIVARKFPFHPVLEYLEKKWNWDGTPRLKSWLSDYLGVEPSEYASAVGMRWMMSAVARVKWPGCKADHCLILEGKQGVGKSTALRVLGEPWFTDEIADLGSKDAALQTRGVWIIELAELESMTRAEVWHIKAFMSRAVDRFRPPYGKRVIESPRQCVFAGTVNHDEYLKDETGGRRFWPVKCGDKIDIDGLAKVKDQLWWEAFSLCTDGKNWWLDDQELIEAATQEQSKRQDRDPWEGLILKWVSDKNKEDVSVQEVLSECLERPAERWTQIDKNRVARCLRRNGWIQFQARVDGRREWRYRRPWA